MAGKKDKERGAVTVVEVSRDPESTKADPKALDGRSLKPATEHKLSELEKAFVPLYADGEFKGNAFAAASAAGYSPSFCKSKAHLLPKRPHILAAINAYIIAHHRAAPDPELEGMFNRLSKISKFDVGSLFETTEDPRFPGGIRMRDLTQIDTSALKKIKVKVTQLGYNLEVEAYDAMRAIELYMKGKGDFGGGDKGKGKRLQFNLIFGGEAPPGAPQSTTIEMNADG